MTTIFLAALLKAVTSPRPALTVLDVARVQEAHAAGHTLPVIAVAMGITKRQAARAVSGQTHGKAVPAEPRRPACMDDDEWDGWQAGNRLQPDHSRADSPCDDCIVGFALEMRAIDRCDGVPAGVEDEDLPLPAIANRGWATRRRHARNRPSEARSAALRLMWAEGRRSREHLADLNRRPDILEARAESMRRRWADPAFRARRARQVKADWRDPEYRARQAQIVRAGRPRVHEFGCARGRRCDCGARSVA